MQKKKSGQYINLKTKKVISKKKQMDLFPKVKTPKIPINKEALKVVSLFTGCGGLDLGFMGGFDFRKNFYKKNRFELSFANDLDKTAVNTYNSNNKYFGDHEVIQGDIRNIDYSKIPEFDFLLAGFPCQPFSSAGLRKGISDDRGTLFEECEEILRLGLQKENKPLGFVFENVRGIMSTKMADGTSVPDEIVKRTKELGFNTIYKLVKASNYGVPSQRYRVIFVGLRKDLGEFDFSLMDDIVNEFEIPSEKSDPYELLVGSILSDIPQKSPQRNDFWKYSPQGQHMVEKIGTCYGNKKILNQFKAHKQLEEFPDKVFKGRSWKNMDREEMPERFRKIHDNPKKYRSPNFYRRFALGEINGTIIASAQPENCGITHPLEHRRYSIREIARIQTFPDDFVFPYSSITNAYKVIGNAVPPVLGWVIAKAIESHFEFPKND